MISTRRMPVRMRACSITALSTRPTGRPAASRMARRARLNCSSIQKITTVSASTSPRQP